MDQVLWEPDWPHTLGHVCDEEINHTLNHLEGLELRQWSGRPYHDQDCLIMHLSQPLPIFPMLKPKSHAGTLNRQLESLNPIIFSCFQLGFELFLQLTTLVLFRSAAAVMGEVSHLESFYSAGSLGSAGSRRPRVEEANMRTLGLSSEIEICSQSVLPNPV